MDDNKITLGDDEFHFSEAEEASSDPYALADDATEEKGSKINRRNILIAIGIIVVALSLYKLIGVFFGAGDSKKTTAVATVSPVKPLVTSTADDASSQADLNKIVADQQQQAAVQIQSQSNVVSEKLKSQLSKMQETDSEHSQQVLQVSSQLSSLSESVGALSASVTGMNQELQNMASRLESQQAAIRAIRSQAKRVTVKRPSRPIYRAPKWYVKAIIPGRAWLRRANGSTTTVRVGDVLKGYGRVRAISVINGTVKLSSGAILTYESI